jgi:hypothetical protein
LGSLPTAGLAAEVLEARIHAPVLECREADETVTEPTLHVPETRRTKDFEETKDVLLDRMCPLDNDQQEKRRAALRSMFLACLFNNPHTRPVLSASGSVI